MIKAHASIISAVFMTLAAATPVQAQDTGDEYQVWQGFRDVCAIHGAFQIGATMFVSAKALEQRYSTANTQLAADIFAREAGNEAGDLIKKAWQDVLAGYDSADIRALDKAIYNFSAPRTPGDISLMNDIKSHVDAELDLREKEFGRQHGLEVDFITGYYPVRPDYCPH